jgi:hypothetical protein
MKFDDGIEFNTKGQLRITYRKDGLYVVGNNMLIPVRDADEGLEIIRTFNRNDAAISSAADG